MKHSLKMILVAMAVSCVVPAMAEENETIAEKPIGWTPVAVGLATPVQLPWGFNRWDIYGVDFNLFYSDAPKMYGFDFGGIASVVRDDNYGVQLSGFFNLSCKEVYGLRGTIGLNMCPTSVYGAEFGGASFRGSITGCDVNILGSVSRKVCGLQCSGIANVTETESCGCMLAGVANVSRKTSGFSFAIFANVTEELHGCQVGLVNFADYCPNGFQIGLVNVIMSNYVKALPFVNGYF